MADKTKRVRMLRTVQGENVVDGGDLEIITKGSVVDASVAFGSELIGSKAAEEVIGKEDLVTVPLHEPEKKGAAAAGK